MFSIKINASDKKVSRYVNIEYSMEPNTGPIIRPNPVNASASPMYFSLLCENS